MKKVIIICILIIFALGNVCYAHSAGNDGDCNTYFIGAEKAAYHDMGGPEEQCGGHGHRHHRHHRHHRDHDDDDCEDIIKGIIILGIVKEVLD